MTKSDLPDRPATPDPGARLLSRNVFSAINGGRGFGNTLSVAAFLIGIGLGYLLWGRTPVNATTDTLLPAERVSPSQKTLAAQVNPPGGYTLPASFEDIGPKLISAGAIDERQFLAALERAGQPITETQLGILREGSAAAITIDRGNARFLLNLFWALGLINRNPILETGPMVQYGEGQIGGYASTGGWTLGQKPATELYSSADIVALTPAQQSRVYEVALAVYRPCCDNPTHFPDCNHGMAMLGLLELMAYQGASVSEMFESAKYVNAFWFPQQTLEQAAFFEMTEGTEYAAVEPKRIVSSTFSSGSGFRAVHQWLAANGALDPAPSNGGGCGV